MGSVCVVIWHNVMGSFGFSDVHDCVCCGLLSIFAIFLWVLSLHPRALETAIHKALDVGRLGMSLEY